MAMTNPNPIRVQAFRCDDPTMRKYDKWGFKIRYNDALIHKTQYEYELRDDAMNAAKAWVEAEYPGKWEERQRRVR